MDDLRSWFRIGVLFARYFWYWWTKRGERPSVNDPPRYEDAMTVLNPILGFYRIDVINPELCPHEGPAVFCGNHIKLDDPFFAYRAVHLATEGALQPYLMSRDDFFVGTPLKSRLIDGDELMLTFSTYLISRSHVTLKQLRPFLNLLKSGDSFVIYPGHTRSCSGVFMEYRGDFKEPGGVSFFVHSTQKGRPLRVPAVPVIRTYNPVSKRSAVVFGESQYLESGADRTAQRAFDFNLAWVMGQYVEVNVPQIVSAILYLRCLHGSTPDSTVSDLRARASSFFEACTHPYVEPEAREDLGGAVLRTVNYLHKRGMLERKGDAVTLDPERILAVPDLTQKYRHINPVKQLTNQVLHLRTVTDTVQEVAL